MRPIDADKLGEVVKEKVGLETGIGREINDGMIVAYAMIAMAPTLTLDDLRPKGRWELADDGDGVVCSECGTDLCILVYATDDFHFCPNCGADMRGGGEE